MIFFFITLVLLLAFIAYIFIAERCFRIELPLDYRNLPGPRGIPFLGPLHLIPKARYWLAGENGKAYGGIYAAKLFGTNNIFITSEKIARDLYKIRGGIYSDRPTVASVHDSRGTSGPSSAEYLILLGRHDLWRRHRKFAHSLLIQGAREGYSHYPILESKRVLFEMLNQPSNYVNIIEDFGAKVMCRLVWANPNCSTELKLRATALLKQLSPPPEGPYINFIKPLANLPAFLSPWKRREKSRHDAEKAFFLQRQNEVRFLMADKRAPPSFMKTFLKTKEQHGFEDDIEGAYLLGQLAVMGSPTIGSVIQNFILAMVQYPQWQAAIQEELDKVVGDRLPVFEDSPNLPLLRAAIRETLRWRPTVPTGGFRQVEEDNFYHGYLIPKGATVHTSEWAFTRNTTLYPNPECFNPARWLSPSYPTYREPVTQFPTISNHSGFGFGQRICIGMQWTDIMAIIGCGGLAWAFTFSKKRDEIGRETPIEWRKTNELLIVKPDAFAFECKPRSERHAEMVREAWGEAREMDPHQREV